MGTMHFESNDMNRNMDVEGITQMSDIELYKTLTKCGMEVGPVVASTRFLYEKKLYQILSNSQSEQKAANNSFVTFPSPDSDRDSPMRTEMADLGSRSISTVLFSPQPSEKLIESPVVEDTTPEPVLEFHTPTSSLQLKTVDETKDDLEFSYRSPSYDYSQVVSRPALYSGGSRSRNRNSELKQEKSSYVGDNYAFKAVHNKPKSTSKASTIIEILLLTFLIVVGYVFYKEMAYYSEAVESKHVDSL